MTRKYTHVQELAEEVYKRKTEGQINLDIGEVYGLTMNQIKGLVNEKIYEQGGSQPVMFRSLRASHGRPPSPRNRINRMRSIYYGSRWIYREIFYKELEGGESEVSSYRTFSG